MDFMAASRLITGEAELDPTLARTYVDAFLAADGGTAELSALLAACAAALGSEDPTASLKAAIASDPTVASGARRLAYFWYAGAPPPQNGKSQPLLTPESYFGALLWRAVGAHPPGLSGGYFGHWRYLPDA
jgi:hypothetical protein